MRAHVAAFLSDVEARPNSPETGVAHRAAGMTCWFAGEYREARDHFERALVLFQPGRDDDLAFRFGNDAGVGAMASLAIASWPLGEVDRAISLIDRMQTRMAGLTHVGTLANGRIYAALFELMRGDRRAPRRTPSNSPASRANKSCPCGARSACFSRVGRPPRRARSATGSRTCAAAPSCCANRTFYCSTG